MAEKNDRWSGRAGRTIGRRAAIRDAGRLLGAGALLGVTGCSGSANPQTSAAIPGPTVPIQPPTPAPSAPTVLSSLHRVRVAVAGSTGEAGIFIAITKGYFQQAGIEIEPVSFDSVVRAIPALGTNQIEVGAGAIGAPFFNAVERGVDIRIVGPQTQAQAEGSRSSLWYVVRQDLWDSGKLRDYVDFKGLSVAVPSRGGSNEYQLDETLRQGGLTPDDINLVELPFSDMLLALENRSLDVAQLTEPGATVAVERGIGAKWRIASDWAPQFQLTYLLYSPEFRTAQADWARRWMVAYLKGARWYGRATADPTDREELFQILAANTALKDTVLMRRITFTTLPPNGDLLSDDILAQGRWAAQRGYISAVPPLEQVIEPQFVQAAVAELGRV